MRSRSISSLASHRDGLALVFFLIFLITWTPLVSGGYVRPPSTLSYHGGPLLTKLDLSLYFYGAIGSAQKRVIRNFLKSLNAGDGAPSASSWWNMVESYHSVSSPSPNAPKIPVKVVSQITDSSYSLGKVITIDFIKMMVKTATAGKPKSDLVVLFTGEQVGVAALCRGQCYDHGVVDNHPYLIVGNPKTECPGDCAWPFIKSTYGPAGITVKPPNGDPFVDAILVNFASGLAAAVTNPFDTGFLKPGPKTWPLEASSVCEGIFATGSFPGNPGKVAVDPKSGGAYNAHGLRGMKFLLPAVWNLRTTSCWTPM